MGVPSNIKDDGRISLTAKQVAAIRSRYWVGGWKQTELAEHYNITQGNVNAIVHNRTWDHQPFPVDAAAARNKVLAEQAEANRLAEQAAKVAARKEARKAAKQELQVAA